MQLLIAKELTLRFDQAQELRELSVEELQLRKDLKKLILGLSSLERTIARQRSRLLFLSEGDANTRFFHLHANGRKRKNYILRLRDPTTGDPVSGDSMATILFNFFSDLLVSEKARPCTLNFEAIGILPRDLSALELPFTEEEVWTVIRALKPEKAPGPDGMTAAFYQAAWPVVKRDVLTAVNAFYTIDRRGFSSVNGALLTLIPKVPNAMDAKDFRPISLIHSFPKIMAKLLANRLAPMIDDLVLCNQSAFIRGRYILDNFKFVQRSAALIKKKKIPKLLLKLDISKAFDTVSWQFLLEILQAWGFGQRWRGWISLLLSTASTRVMLNGHPGPPIQHRRGLRQGDPLSPMLFVIVMDALNRLFIKAGIDNVLQPTGVPAIRHHCSLYADDAILLLTPTATEALAVRHILQVFGDASGLVTNVDKC